MEGYFYFCFFAAVLQSPKESSLLYLWLSIIWSWSFSFKWVMFIIQLRLLDITTDRERAHQVGHRVNITPTAHTKIYLFKLGFNIFTTPKNVVLPIIFALFAQYFCSWESVLRVNVSIFGQWDSMSPPIARGGLLLLLRQVGVPILAKWVKNQTEYPWGCQFNPRPRSVD